MTRSLAWPIATAAAAAAFTAAAAPPTPPAEQRRICRGGERQLGTRLRTPRRCLTAEQWQREDEAASRLPPSLQVTQGQNDGRAPAQPR